MLIIFDFIMDQYSKFSAKIFAFILVKMGNRYPVFVSIILTVFNILFAIVFCAAFAINLAVLAFGLRMLWDWLKIICYLLG